MGDMFGDFIPNSVDVANYLRCVCLFNVSITAFCIIPIIYGTYTLRVIDSQRMAPEEATSRCATENSIFSDELMYRCYKCGCTTDPVLNEDQLDELLIQPEVEIFLLTQGLKMFACEALAIASQGDSSGGDTGSMESMTVQEFVELCTYMRQTNTSPQAVGLGD